METVVSGMRPTGRLPLGHLNGALRNWVSMQKDYRCFFFVADWHALTTDYLSPQGIRQSALDMVMDWLSVGLDPKRSVLFRQSDVKEHAELHLLLSMTTPVPWLERNPTYKEQMRELEGRDLYVREGCVGCHSQMVRPFRFETERYGEYSKSGEFVYDRPFLWGSKRTGPDLAREGVGKLKKSDSWHYNHMYNPRNVYEQSIMPAYPWMITNDLDTSLTAKKIKVLRGMGVPYEEGYETIATGDLAAQAKKIADNLRAEGIKQDGLERKEIIALIAYLQRLGVDISAQAQAKK